jgi:hypothetical protein
MPRFYFHLYNDEIVRDEEGLDLPDMDAARDEAMRAARELIGEEAKRGQVTLSHRIEVEDEIGLPCFTIRYRDAVEVRSGD